MFPRGLASPSSFRERYGRGIVNRHLLVAYHSCGSGTLIRNPVCRRIGLQVRRCILRALVSAIVFSTSYEMASMRNFEGKIPDGAGLRERHTWIDVKELPSACTLSAVPEAAWSLPDVSISMLFSTETSEAVRFLLLASEVIVGLEANHGGGRLP